MLNIRLPEELERQLVEEARLTSKSRSQLTREALALYLRVRRRRRFLMRMRRAADAVNDAEALALADESLVFDNEAQAIAEGRGDYDPGEVWWK